MSLKESQDMCTYVRVCVIMCVCLQRPPTVGQVLLMLNMTYDISDISAIYGQVTCPCMNVSVCPACVFVLEQVEPICSFSKTP